MHFFVRLRRQVPADPPHDGAGEQLPGRGAAAAGHPRAPEGLSAEPAAEGGPEHRQRPSNPRVNVGRSNAEEKVRQTPAGSKTIEDAFSFQVFRTFFLPPSSGIAEKVQKDRKGKAVTYVSTAHSDGMDGIL